MFLFIYNFLIFELLNKFITNNLIIKLILKFYPHNRLMDLNIKFKCHIQKFINFFNSNYINFQIVNLFVFLQFADYKKFKIIFYLVNTIMLNFIILFIFIIF